MKIGVDEVWLVIVRGSTRISVSPLAVVVVEEV